MQTLSDILEQEISDISPELLEFLLVDRTSSNASMQHNIIWANDNYAHLGKGYAPTDEIQPQAITGQNSRLIQPRALKNKEVQKKRTKKHAEVFTPSWIVKKMIDGMDSENPGWNEDLDTFVDRTWLEITCGEAPFIANRYEMESGELIELKDRTGFLDRKLRRINEDVDGFDAWFDYVCRAYKASYGFEWSGDSIVLARENLVMTFVDYYREKWDAEPSLEEVLQIAEIVSYNVFQMDGLKQIIPLSESEETVSTEIEQPDLFGNVEVIKTSKVKKIPGKRVKVMNWKKGKMEYFGQ